MSKERELLKKIWEDLDADRDNYNALCDEIEGLLETPKQEPVAWVSKLTGFITTEDQGDTSSWVPLYLAPPKPEILTHKQDVEAYKRVFYTGYNAAVRDLKRKVDSVFNLIMEE